MSAAEIEAANLKYEGMRTAMLQTPEGREQMRTVGLATFDKLVENTNGLLA